MLNNNDIFNSKKVLLNISYSSQYKLMMSEMDEVKEFMNRFSRDFETKFGMAIDDKLEQKVKITLLATGFGIQDIHMKEMETASPSAPPKNSNALPSWRRKRNRDATAAKCTTARMPTPVPSAAAVAISISSIPKTWTTPTSSAW